MKTRRPSQSLHFSAPKEEKNTPDYVKTTTGKRGERTLASQLVEKALHALADPQRAASSQRFFKTQPGQYGHGDQFIGVSVPQIRALAKQYAHDLTLEELKPLMQSPIHEERLLALIVLTYQYPKTSDKKSIVDFYLANKKWVNNWDLVDSSAATVLGAYLFESSSKCLEPTAQHKNRLCACLLDNLASSEVLWDRRIAIIATHYFIKRNDFRWTLHLAQMLLQDNHDLMHKAVGWMLREVNKYGGHQELISFLDTRHTIMPRTMLRYAIEHLDTQSRASYMRT